jgi:hypothetical protein
MIGVSRYVRQDRGESPRVTAGTVIALHWRTLHRAVGTEDTAVTMLWAQQSLAVGAFVKELARIGRHCLSFAETANWAQQHGF